MSNPLALHANHSFCSIFTFRSPKDRTLSEKLPACSLASQPCSTLELAVTCRCAWACLIIFSPGIFANVLFEPDRSFGVCGRQKLAVKTASRDWAIRKRAQQTRIEIDVLNLSSADDQTIFHPLAF